VPGVARALTTFQPAADFHSPRTFRHASAFLLACGERPATPETASLRTWLSATRIHASSSLEVIASGSTMSVARMRASWFSVPNSFRARAWSTPNFFCRA
jgi:hypothetical protein